MADKISPDAKFLIWTFDPCYEGGWHVEETALTLEEAEQKCRTLHEAGLKRVKEMRAYLAERGRDAEVDAKVMACYGKAMVTPSAVFELEA